MTWFGLQGYVLHGNLATPGELQIILRGLPHNPIVLPSWSAKTPTSPTAAFLENKSPVRNREEERQRKRNACTLAHAAFRADRSSMCRDNCLNDGKAEAASPTRASTCPVNAEEAVEDEG